jgi:8-oxo-dGTP diphosphatase
MRRVTAAVIIEDGRILLARRPPGDPLAGLWELPGGKIEDGETPQECLERELLEELAMRAEVGPVLARTVYRYPHGVFELLALQATRTSDFELRAHDAFSWVDLEEAQMWALAPADQLLISELLRNSDEAPTRGTDR